MSFNGALLIAVAIGFAGMYIGDSIRALRLLNVEMQSNVRVVQGTQHGPQ